MNEIHPNPQIIYEPNTFSLAWRAMRSQIVFHGIHRYGLGNQNRRSGVTFTARDWTAFDRFQLGWRRVTEAEPIYCTPDTSNHVAEGLTRLSGKDLSIPVPEPISWLGSANELFRRQRDRHRIMVDNVVLHNRADVYEQTIQLLQSCVTQAEFLAADGTATFSLDSLESREYCERHLSAA